MTDLAMRASYDVVAEAYAELVGEHVDEDSLLERAVLGLFAGLVHRAARSGEGPAARQGAPRVLDVGCGTGRVVSHLCSLGLDVAGVDPSAGMLAHARRTNPGIGFAVGSWVRLPVADASVAGVLGWYSLIHLETRDFEAAAREVHRVLEPGGKLLTGFHVGTDVRRNSQAYGQDAEIVTYRRTVEEYADVLTAAGLEVHTRVAKEPEGRELVPQGAVLARRPR